MKTRIIYEDQHILVCYKPAGLATQTARVGQQDMVSELKNYLAGKARQQSIQPERQKNAQKAGEKKAAAKNAAAKNAAAKKSGQPYLGVIHRLDQPVEGLLVFAKDSASAAKLTAQLSQGTLNKQYYAAVCGRPPAESAELVDYLTKDDDSGSAVVVNGQGAVKGSENANTPKKAVLQYHIMGKAVAEPKQGDPGAQYLSTQEHITMLDIHIDTGRFHQIRAQMAHAGLPLLGDSRYGNEISIQFSRSLQVRNVALCAYKIVLKHPVTGKQMEFSVKPEGKIFSNFSII